MGCTDPTTPELQPRSFISEKSVGASTHAAAASMTLRRSPSSCTPRLRGSTPCRRCPVSMDLMELWTPRYPPPAARDAWNDCPRMRSNAGNSTRSGRSSIASRWSHSSKTMTTNRVGVLRPDCEGTVPAYASAGGLCHCTQVACTARTGASGSISDNAAEYARAALDVRATSHANSTPPMMATMPYTVVRPTRRMTPSTRGSSTLR